MYPFPFTANETAEARPLPGMEVFFTKFTVNSGGSASQPVVRRTDIDNNINVYIKTDIFISQNFKLINKL